MTVQVKWKTSSQRNVTNGERHGSVLGPILFFTFVNNVASNLLCQYEIYADDLKIYMKIHNDRLLPRFAGLSERHHNAAANGRVPVSILEYEKMYRHPLWKEIACLTSLVLSHTPGLDPGSEIPHRFRGSGWRSEVSSSCRFDSTEDCWPYSNLCCVLLSPASSYPPLSYMAVW